MASSHLKLTGDARSICVRLHPATLAARVIVGLTAQGYVLKGRRESGRALYLTFEPIEEMR